MNETLIIIGGSFCAFVAAYHLFFVKVYGWEQDFSASSQFNQNLVRIVNFCLAFSFAIFAFLCLAHTQELLTTEIGHSLIIAICGLWAFRAALEAYYNRLASGRSRAVFTISILACAIYAIPAVTHA